MRARPTLPYVAARRVLARTAVLAAVLALLATGVVVPPANSDLRAEVQDRVQTLVEGRAERGYQRRVETGHPTQLVGFEWEGSSGGAVEVRARTAEGWTDWQLVHGEPTEGPDVGSREHHEKTTAGPVWVGRDAAEVEVRVVEGSLPNLKLHALRAEDPPSGGGGLVVRPAGAAPAQPGIVTRASWGADESFRTRNPGCSQPTYAPNVRFSVVHHTAGTNTYTAADSAAIIRAIYHFHTHTNLWCDIGYNFLVDRFGTVFEGRFGGITQAVVGAHAQGFNTGSTGAAVLGTFTTVQVPSPAYDAVRRLLAWKLALHGVDPMATITAGGVPVRTISGHGDFNATECPGDLFEARLPQLRADVAADMGYPPITTSTYHPLTPARVLDTRAGIGAATGPVGTDRSIDVKVTGVGGVPPTGVSAVALNVTATNASGPLSYLTVWPKGAPRPLASNLNFSSGVSVPNMVVARVGADGSVSIYNNIGIVSVVADVLGWYGANGSTFVPVNPSRILDTRTGSGPVGPGGTIQLGVTGVGGVPASGVTAVVLNMTVDRATGPESYLTVWPAGAARPTASNLNFSAGPASTNLVVVPVGADGRVSVYNNLGSTDVIADVAGWFGTTGTPYVGITPSRVLDTRTGSGPLGPGATLELPMAGVGGVPANVTSVVLNVTVNQPSAPDSFLTLFPAGTARPLASNLNFVAGETVANLVAVRVQNGRVAIYNNAGTTHVIADVQGWFGPG